MSNFHREDNSLHTWNRAKGSETGWKGVPIFSSWDKVGLFSFTDCGRTTGKEKTNSNQILEKKKRWEMAKSRTAPLCTGNNCSSNNQGLWQSCWWGLRSRLVHRNRTYISWLLKLASFTCFDHIIIVSSHLGFSYYLLQNLNNIHKKIKPKGTL